jgi:hypothetical protein
VEQLILISEVVKHRQKPITEKNQQLMKKCFADVYKLGMVSSETMNKVLNTNYVRGI